MTECPWLLPKTPSLDTPAPFKTAICVLQILLRQPTFPWIHLRSALVTATTAARRAAAASCLSGALISLGAVLPHQIRALLEAVGL